MTTANQSSPKPPVGWEGAASAGASYSAGSSATPATAWGAFGRARGGAQLFAVASCPGDHLQSGSESRLAIASMGEAFTASPNSELAALLEKAFGATHDRIAQAPTNGDGKSDTATGAAALCLGGGEEGYVAHSGDSRIYRMRGEGLLLIGGQPVVARGEEVTGETVPERPANSGVPRPAGGPSSPPIELTRIEVAPGDRFLLCSNGWPDPLAEETLAAALGDGNCREIALRVMRLAEKAAGPDQFCVQVVAIPETPLAAQPHTPTTSARSGQEPGAGPLIHAAIIICLLVGLLLLIFGGPTPSGR